MRKGFFSQSQLSSTAAARASTPRCGLCGLYRTCRAPRMEPFGEGRKRILLVGEAPGKTEDEWVDEETGRKGRQFIGDSGQYLRNALDDVGIDMDEDCVVTNSLICRPPGNKLPKKSERLKQILTACRPNLMATIKAVNPDVIILLGGTACKSLLPILWKNDIGKVGTWGSWTIPSQVLNAWVCPTFHPSFMLRQPGPTLEMKFQEDLRRAVALRGKPWKTVPNYLDQVDRIYKPREASLAIRKLVQDALKRNVPIAFDYEANCVKPEYPGAEIVSCSMSNGEMTIAYPWVGDAIAKTDEVLRLKTVRKIASNLKYEDRWTRFFLKHPVEGWYWDTMVAAHILDNREDITSVKFQAFILLGVKAWDEHIKTYLSTKGVHHLNRIKELPIQELLLYNGMDSLIEWLVARKQTKMIERMKQECTDDD